MQRKKNIRSIVLLVILGSSAVVLALTGNRSGRKITNDRQFMIEDTVSVSRIVIEGEDFINTLERTGGIWKINEKYPADNSMVRVLMAVLHEVRVHRKAPRQMLFEITEGMKSKGIKVSVYDRQDLIHSFIAWGNGTSVSYFKEDESDPLVVHLPGYNSYVTGIFEVKENDWRDRLIVSTSWSGLKKYLLEYPGEINDGFTIISDGLLPSIREIPEPDTAALMDYLVQAEYFAADQFINRGAVPQYDSLSATTPWAVLIIDAVSLDKPVTVKFFNRLPGDPLLLGIIDNVQPALFSYDRIKRIFITRSDFMTK